jgi:hypothetical protein
VLFGAPSSHTFDFSRPCNALDLVQQRPFSQSRSSRLAKNWSPQQAYFNQTCALLMCAPGSWQARALQPRAWRTRILQPPPHHPKERNKRPALTRRAPCRSCCSRERLCSAERRARRRLRTRRMHHVWRRHGPATH